MKKRIFDFESNRTFTNINGDIPKDIRQDISQDISQEISHYILICLLILLIFLVLPHHGLAAGKNVGLEPADTAAAAPLSIAITAPVKGQRFQLGETIAITWNKTGVQQDSVVISLRLRGIFHGYISRSTANDGSFSWTVPDSLFPATSYSIRVGTLNGAVSGYSGVFLIEDPGGYYVSLIGNNNNNGSITSAWRSIQYALNRLSPGDRLYIARGTYREQLYMNRSGDSTGRILIRGEKANVTIIDGSSAARDLLFLEGVRAIDIYDLTFTKAPRSGVRLSFAHGIVMRRCIFSNNGRWGLFTDFSNYTGVFNCQAYGSKIEHGIYISNSSDNVVIRANKVHHNQCSGIQINSDPSMGGDGISSNCTIEANVVYENGKGGGSAINLASVRNSKIQNNILYNNYAGGIGAWDDGQGSQWGSQNLSIFHNTVYFRPGEGRWAISLKNGSTGAQIYNNLLIGGRRGAFEYNGNCLDNIQIDYNIFYSAGISTLVTNEDTAWYTLAAWQAEGYDLHTDTSTPQDLFINHTNGNFHIKTTSLALDNAFPVNVNTDYESTPRPRGAGPDIGADEN